MSGLPHNCPQRNSSFDLPRPSKGSFTICALTAFHTRRATPMCYGPSRMRQGTEFLDRLPGFSPPFTACESAYLSLRIFLAILLLYTIFAYMDSPDSLRDSHRVHRRYKKVNAQGSDGQRLARLAAHRRQRCFRVKGS